MLTAVLGIVVAFMLSRQGTQALTIERHLSSYREHHTGKGIKEVIDAFLMSVRGRDSSRFIAPDGRVLDMELPGGGRLTVYMSDGQSQILNPVTAGAERASAEAMAQAAGEGVATRNYGPAQVSINSASREALVAAARLATGGAKGDEFADAVLAARASKPIEPQEVAKLAQNAGFSPEQITELRNYLTAEPQIWNVEARLIPGAGPAFSGARVERVYSGYAQLGGLPRGSPGGAANMAWSRRTSIHDWKEVLDPRPRPGSDR
jgi:hypothetical protein